MTKILAHIEDAENEETLPEDFIPANTIHTEQFLKVNRKGDQEKVLSIWYWKEEVV